MKTNYIISLLATFIFIFFISCEKDQLAENDSDATLEFRGKGGNKGKPDKPDDSPSGITYEFLDGINGAGAMPRAINGDKWVVGESGGLPVVWENNSSPNPLPGLDGMLTGTAWDINDNYTIVGTLWSEVDSSNHAVMWTLSDGNYQISSLEPSSDTIVNSTAHGVNNLGVSCGSLSSESNFWAWVYPDQPVGTRAWARDINDQGAVVGEVDLSVATNNQILNAFYWTEGEPILLGTLGGESSLAVAVNNTNQVVGWSELANGYILSFIWTDGVMDILPTLLGLTMVQDISENGHVVGTSMVSTGGNSNRGYPHAYLSPGGVDPDDRVAVDLGTAGGIQSEAQAVADAIDDPDIDVYVVGRRYSRKGGSRVVLWTVDLDEF